MNYELIDNGVVVELHDETGEGWFGDYDQEDSEDEPLLRFDISLLDESGDRIPVDNGSYCTALSARSNPAVVDKALKLIMNEVRDAVLEGSSIKKTCEKLSWMQEKDFC